MTPSHNLNYAEMGILKRRHGILVTRQVAGKAWTTLKDGTRAERSIDELRRIAQRPISERLMDWLAGVSPREEA